MLAQVLTAALKGVDSFLVRVEVQVTPGLPSFSVVGLPHGAVREGRDRVLAALQNTGLRVPPRRIVVNLAPADVPKVGSAFDLPIAIGLMVGTGRLPGESLEETAFVGELGLDGTVRPVRGALSMALGCRSAGVRRVYVPAQNGDEAGVVSGIEVTGVPSLAALVSHLDGSAPLPRARVRWRNGARSGTRPDLREVRGQEAAKRALEIAAAGAHNLLMTGPPGTGKTMLARRLPGLLPVPSLAEALEITRVHSVAGALPAGSCLARDRPFRSPHHSISTPGLVGGGNPVRPGEASLAHYGLLFLDELPEFRRSTLEALRQPLEEGRVHVVRVRESVCFPARFQLVAAMNPCPCGHRGDGTDRCVCDPVRVARYLGRVSGPLLDRLDLAVPVTRVPSDRITGGPEGPSTDEVAERVMEARDRQAVRFRDAPDVFANGHMDASLVRSHGALDRETAAALARAADRLELSARAIHRTIKVARTIADLAGSDGVGTPHVLEALQFRHRAAETGGP